jgi:lipopolysaccharide transport protein LptA
VPATHYIVSVQVALLAASAAYLKSDKPEGPNRQRPNVAAEMATSFTEAKDEATAMAEARGGRFALAEQVGELPEVTSRSMGFRGGMPVRGRLTSELSAQADEGEMSLTLPAEGELSDLPKPSTKVKKTSIPETPVALSEVLPEEVKFDPVPNGAGYSITADSATNFDLKSKTVVFEGSVSLHCNEFTLAADRLVVHMESESGSMSRMVANGNVDVNLTKGSREERYQGFGEEATYDPKGQSIVFRGWPRILGHGREHRAAAASTQMTLHTNPAKLVTQGRAQTRIIPGEGGSLSGFGAQAAQ